ncbi:MAG: ankyrin repeat domain-containing protein [Bacteroidetes bacterium]|nr:ankyrin repeat domain-containing protein [Bacteroidota bacterium]
MKIKRTHFFLMIYFFLIANLHSQSIHDVILHGDLLKVKSLVENNPNLLEFTNDNYNSCIHYGARTGFVEIIEFLIQKGADVNSENIAQETPLHFAAAFGHPDAIIVLLKNGANINAKNYEGSTPLHYAVQFADMQSIEPLVENGTDVNARNILDYTPLDYACAFHKEDVIKYLKSYGALASQPGDPEIAQLTENVYRITYPYCERSNIAVLRGNDGLLLVDTGCDEKLIEILKNDLIKLDSGEIQYIINTHLHQDHIAGNSIGGDNCTIISYTNLEKLVTEGTLTKQNKPLKGSNGKSFDSIYTLNFDDEKKQIIPYPGVHTNEDIMVYFPNSGVVHLGDLFISQSFPSVFQNVPGYLEFLEIILNVFPESTIYIGGHGKEVNYDDLGNYYKMLLKTNTVILQKLKDGETVKEIRKSSGLSGYDQWGEFIPQLSIIYWIERAQ